MAVGMRMAVLAIKHKFNCAGLANGGIDRFQILADVIKRHRLQEREVEVF
jgi:hypothetical protein